MTHQELIIRLANAMSFHLGPIAMDRAEQIALSRAVKDPQMLRAAMGRTQILAQTYGLPIPSDEDVAAATLEAEKIMAKMNDWTEVRDGD